MIRPGAWVCARFAISGHIGRELPMHYYIDYGYNGFDAGFDLSDDDEYTLYNLELRPPETPLGQLTVGRHKALASISKNWAGAYLPLFARPAPVSSCPASRHWR